MKKSLYSTTALAAAGLLTLGASDAFAQAAAPAAPEKFKLELGGFFNQFVGVQSSSSRRERADGAQLRTFDQKSDSEVYFQGTMKLDSGISIGVMVQLETDSHTSSTSLGFSGTSSTVNTTNNNYIDESYMRIFGDFGEVRLGAMDGASQGISITAPSVGLVNIANSDLDGWVKKPSGQATISSTCCSTTFGGGDANRVWYTSPSFAGLRGAGSFTPSSANSNAQPTNGGADNDGWTVDLALQYAAPDIMGFKPRAYVGWWRNGGARNPNTGTTSADAQTGSFSSDSLSWGADVTFGDITVGGGFLSTDNNGNSTVDNAAKTNDQQTYNLGVAYKPAAYALSLNWQRRTSEVTAADPDNDTMTRYILGATYPIGPGVTLSAQGVHQRSKSETNAANGEDKQWALIGGIGVSF